MEKEISVVLDNEHNQLVVSSLQVAKNFGKRHDKLISEIERMYGELTDKWCAQNGGDPLFYKTTYIHEQNKQQYPMFLMNRDGFSLLVMGFTGKEAMNWKLKYIQAFNAMEKRLMSPKMDETKQKDIDLRYMNAKARIASIWLKLSDRVPRNTEYQQICNSYASEVLTGEKVLPLPKCDERYYTATEIAKMVDSNKNTVGKKAKAAGIRPADENTESEYGMWFFDKSPNSNKEVTSFRYNQKGVDAIKALFGDGKEK